MKLDWTSRIFISTIFELGAVIDVDNLLLFFFYTRLLTIVALMILTTSHIWSWDFFHPNIIFCEMVNSFHTEGYLSFSINQSYFVFDCYWIFIASVSISHILSLIAIKLEEIFSIIAQLKIHNEYNKSNIFLCKNKIKILSIHFNSLVEINQQCP